MPTESQRQSQPTRAPLSKTKRKLRTQSEAPRTTTNGAWQNENESCKIETIKRDGQTGSRSIFMRANARLYRPICDDTQLSTQLAHSFDNLDLQRAWFAYVPRYVGENKAIDSAAKAVIIAWRNRAQNSLPPAGVRHYADAIQGLRDSLDTSDLSLLCVALMANFETVATAAPVPMYHHVQGLAAIIKTRSNGFHNSEVARAVLYTFSDELFRLACLTNTFHPLDNPRHRDLDPPSRTTSRDETVLSLRRTGFRLFVRLPRLISSFRAWQQQVDRGIMVHVPASLLVLARELLDLRNQDAEDRLLHRIGIVPTKEKQTREFMPYSFAFGYLSEAEAIGLYWEARLLLVSICMRIRTLECCVQIGLDSGPRKDTGSNEVFTKTKEEKQSCLANIIMTWQYIITTPILAKDAVQALLVMWGAIADLEKFRHHSIASIQSWILEQTRGISRDYPSHNIDADFMDRESGILFGHLGSNKGDTSVWEKPAD
jgi:hypothetical protein